MSSGAWILIGSLAGYAASLLQAHLTEHRNDQRDERRRLADRADRLADFQRAALLELQEALVEVARAAAKLHHDDLMAYRRHNTPWGHVVHGTEWNEKSMLAQRRAATLRERVADDALREAIDQVTAVAASLTLARSEGVRQRHFSQR